MRPRLLLLLSLTLAACSHKQPPVTWTNAHWGMLPSEVMNAVPELASEDGGHLATGASARLRTDAASIAGTALPAEFFFLDSRLVQITFGDGKYRDNAANEKTLVHLAASLRQQYGQESTARAMDPAQGLSRETTWVAGDTDISLVAVPVTATTSMVSLIYRKHAAS